LHLGGPTAVVAYLISNVKNLILFDAADGCLSGRLQPARSSLSKVSTKPRAIQLLIIENSQEGSARPRYDEFNENDNARVWSINTQSSFCGPDSFHLFDLCHASLRNCLAVKAIGERTIDECQNCCQQHCSGFRAAG
ncbi:hypothetical protein, partial [Pseudomonas sp. TWR3-1-1]|uniref:hypothetical protein n=1 Tax=Pseudomonas sp. TWR3-1-1 TaxID=2804633 RepID=UPI003CEAA649